MALSNWSIIGSYNVGSDPNKANANYINCWKTKTNVVKNKLVLLYNYKKTNLIITKR